MDISIRNWYLETFPTDDLGRELNNDVTFDDLFEILMNDNDNFYSHVGVGDSIVRERLFAKLANLFNIPYDAIYGLWMR